jgi:hypothetical protein
VTVAAQEDPLHRPAAAGDKEFVARVLAGSAEVNAKINVGWTPLHYAVGPLLNGLRSAQAEVKKPAVRSEERSPVDQGGATPFESRSFGPGATESLIKTGDASERTLGSVSRTETSISFSMKTIYDIALYLDEAGARQVFAPFKGPLLEELLKGDDIHRAVIEGDFPKAVVLSLSQNCSARDVQMNLRDSFALSSAYGTPEASRFLNYFKGNFREGDEVVIRFLDERVLTTVARKPQPEIRSQRFSRALLGIWMGKKKQSGDRSGLLSEIGPLLK